jgi:hypothetical protein
MYVLKKISKPECHPGIHRPFGVTVTIKTRVSNTYIMASPNHKIFQPEDFF